MKWLKTRESEVIKMPQEYLKNPEEYKEKALRKFFRKYNVERNFVLHLWDRFLDHYAPDLKGKIVLPRYVDIPIELQGLWEKYCKKEGERLWKEYYKRSLECEMELSRVNPDGTITVCTGLGEFLIDGDGNWIRGGKCYTEEEAKEVEKVYQKYWRDW